MSWKWIMTVSARGCEFESDCLIFIVTGENTLNFVSAPQEASHYDELSMKQSFNFLDSLKDLKHLRKQLYSAADYFELSYNRHDHKQIVVNTLKDYVTRAFINIVDHLGFMTYKVNCLLDDKIEEASAIELRFSCSTCRLRMCEMFIDHGGLSQQSLAIRTPKNHMQYILTVSKSKDGGDSKNLRYCMINGVMAKCLQYPSKPRRSTSMSTHVERNRRSGIELRSSKNKHLFKALLSMRKSRKDSKSYKFLDEK
ncbi:hypothetical protein EUGRSUZ_E01014 [Eucalyptus grandis]|uniref:Uncharacterized protein n=2 Tax=Eucalyptus grandis TaxID=71139 RepID=A0ACC3KTE6_EUCGR|nr:hypothetical protein EUGRSUZ_E01014 [Eucalyptus grandis]